MLKKIVQSPYLNLLSGVILLITAGYETWTSIEDMSLGVHHGMLIFSLAHIARTIPEVMHGLKELNEAKLETVKNNK